MSWRNQYWSYWMKVEDINHYDLYELAFDAPILFDKIFSSAIDAYDGYDFDPSRVWDYETEMAAITAAQWEVFGGQSAKIKTNRYDHEVLKIKNDLLWAGVQSSDTVEVVFWQDSFDSLVSFARRTKRHTVTKLLEVQCDELREAGFSYDFITKTASALTEWAEKLLNPDEKEFENEQIAAAISDEDNDNVDIASYLFFMFYANQDNDAERGDDDGD